MKKKKYVAVLAGITLVMAFVLLRSVPKVAAMLKGPSLEKAVETPAAAKDDFDEFDEFDEKPSIAISDAIMQKLGVKTAKVVSTEMVKTLRAPGIVGHDETSLVTINTKISGWIEKLHLDYEGKAVKKGEPLAEIYSPELVSAQEELLIFSGMQSDKQGHYADVLSNDAYRLIDAVKKRLRYWDITDKQVEDVIRTGKLRKTMAVYSPANGFVVKKTATEGMKVTPGQELFQVANLDKVWIIADVYEQDMQFIKPGQETVIHLSNLPGKSLKTRVDYIYPELSEKTRTVKVRFPVNNKDGLLMPDMFTEVHTEISLGSRTVVPDDAVIDDGMRKIVFVQKEEGVYEPREVKTGIKNDRQVEILAGLSVGETVAQGANFLLDSEAQLKGITPLKEW